MEKCFNYPCPLLSAHQGPHWRPAKLSRSCRFPAPPQNKWTKALKESSLWHGQLKDWCTQRQYFFLRHVWVSDSFSEYCFSFKWFNDNKFWILLVCSRSPKPSGGLNYFPYEKPSLSSQPTFPFTLWGFFVGFLLGGFVCFGFFKNGPFVYIDVLSGLQNTLKSGAHLIHFPHTVEMDRNHGVHFHSLQLISMQRVAQHHFF